MKGDLRRQIKATLAAMPAEEAAARSRDASGRLAALEEFHRARVVMAYLSIPGELSCDGVAEAAWGQAKTVVVPKIIWNPRHMIAVQCNGLDDAFVIGPFGIREPAADRPVPPQAIDLIVVPALAYDRRGNRLGRGGGFYDRFLAQPGLRAVTCGVAFSEQLVDRVPVGPHDRRVNLLVTDDQVLRFA